MKAETRTFYEAAVERTVARIVDALDEALDLGALAREAALSPFHFHRVFRGLMGETPLELHRRLRLERAARQLLDSRVAVTTIAFDAGYETHEAFTRTFRHAYGISPSAFRQDPALGAIGCTRPRAIELAAPSGLHLGEPAFHFVTGESLMNVSIETRPELRLATVHHVGPYPRISEAFARLGELVGPEPLRRFPDAAMIAIYHDDPESTPADQLQADAGLTVPEGAALPTGLAEQRIPAGRYARTTHVGPYTLLPDAWARFMGQWLPQSGHRVGAGPTYEVYRNTPEHAAPDQLHTDLYLSLA